MDRRNGQASLRTQRFPLRTREMDRFKFGKMWYLQTANSQFKKTLFSLDIGSGHLPFPWASVVCDLYTGRVPDRSMRELSTGGKPFLHCDAHFLPFRDQSFEFATCYYLLEHLDYPSKVMREIRRVSRHGYVQSPSWFDEIVYGDEMHKWYMTSRDGELYMRPKVAGWLNPCFGFLSHKLYRSHIWRIMHAILDETLHLFTVSKVF